MSWWLDSLAVAAARRRTTTRLAALLRNQAERVLQFHFARAYHEAGAAEAHYLAKVSPCVRTFLDVGANRGNWSACLLGHAPSARGVLFEPGSQARAQAEERFRGRAGISVRGQALGASPGVATFHESLGASESSGFLADTSQGTTRPAAVELTTIDAVLDELGWERLDVCKVDCEGWDLDVLRGASRALGARRIQLVQFEYNTHWRLRGSTLRAARELLTSCGYELLLLAADGLFDLPWDRYGEYFAYSNFVAVCRGSEAASLLDSLRRGTGGY